MFTKAQRLRKRFLRSPQRKRDQAWAYQRAEAAFPRPGSCLAPLPLPLVPTAGSGVSLHGAGGAVQDVAYGAGSGSCRGAEG